MASYAPKDAVVEVIRYNFRRESAAVLRKPRKRYKYITERIMKVQLGNEGKFYRVA